MYLCIRQLYTCSRVKSFATYMVMLWLLLLPPACRLWSQVNICYTFEDAIGNTRPTGWGALPNLDYHYVGIDAYDNTAHTGSKALRNNGVTCFAIMPDEGIDYGGDSVWLTFWYYLHLNTDYFEVGYLTDATDSSTFHVLDTLHDWQQEWHFAAVDLSSVPTGARIAFFGHDLFCNDGTFWLDDMHLTSTPCAAWGLRVAENRADSVRLEWESLGAPTLTLTLNWTPPYNVNGNSFSFARNYYESFNARLTAQCPVANCNPNQPYNNVYIHRYREGSCLDVIDLYSTMTIAYYGTPVEPYLHEGTYTTTAPGVTGIYAGTHALNTNPGSDGGGMMVFPRTIPPGDSRTLRLGNRLGDWESASMLYTITVDTNETDLLVMKYTVAMAFGTFQGPEEAYHSDTLHPAWFRIELLDTNLSPLGDGCSRFYINMWDTTGWDETNNMYKRRNFTGMAFDLRPYHGQRLRLRVTTCDGAVNNRWCYAYYNFSCLKHHDVVHDCSGDSVTLEAPYGFLYHWWRDGDSVTVGNTQSVTMPADGTLYHCSITNRFNPHCSDTITRFALPGSLVTVCDTVVENDLPQTFRGVVFHGPVDTIFTVPSDVGCDTVVHYSLHVWPNQSTLFVQRFCPDQWPVDWLGHHFDGPDSLTLGFTDIHGADSIVTIVAANASTYDTSYTEELCPGMIFEYAGVDYGGPVSFDTVFFTVDGCDSIVHVSLILRDSTFRIAALYSTDRLNWSDTLPIALCQNQTLYVVDSSQDSPSRLWISPVGDTSTLQLAQFSFQSVDTVQGSELLLIASGQSGCIDTLRLPVLVFPSPQAEFEWTPEHPVDISPQVQLINLTQPSGCSWLWTIVSDDGNIDSITDFSPSYNWDKNSVVSDLEVLLRASLSFGQDGISGICFDTVSHDISVVTAWLYFPSLVTPNGDGVNDRWEIVNLVELGLYPTNEVWIYNRWGTLVFHARNINSHSQSWDPDHPYCPDGTYFFRFSALSDYGAVRRNGVIEVVR